MTAMPGTNGGSSGLYMDKSHRVTKWIREDKVRSEQMCLCLEVAASGVLVVFLLRAEINGVLLHLFVEPR